eukprot:4358378-Prymnesium_polylepis.2
MSSSWTRLSSSGIATRMVQVPSGPEEALPSGREFSFAALIARELSPAEKARRAACWESTQPPRPREQHLARERRGLKS